MYRIKTPSGDSFLIELPTYVRQHSTREFLITDQKHAEGVGYGGKYYLFKDGNQLQEVDVGADIQTSQETEAMTLELAADHEERLCLMELGI